MLTRASFAVAVVLPLLGCATQPPPQVDVDPADPHAVESAPAGVSQTLAHEHTAAMKTAPATQPANPHAGHTGHGGQP